DDDRFSSVPFLSETIQSDLKTLKQVRITRSVSDPDRMGDRPPIGCELVEDSHLFIEFNDGDPVLGGEGVQESSRRQCNILAETFRRSAHIKHHYNAEGSRRKLKMRDILLDAVFVDRKMRPVKVGHRAAPLIDHADIHADDSRINVYRVIHLRPRCNERSKKDQE